jgi:hypothetical protein
VGSQRSQYQSWSTKAVYKKCTLVIYCYILLLYFTTVIVSVGDPTMHSTFFVWVYTTTAWRWITRVETCSPAISHYMFSNYYCCVWLTFTPFYITRWGTLLTSFHKDKGWSFLSFEMLRRVDRLTVVYIYLTTAEPGYNDTDLSDTSSIA